MSRIDLSTAGVKLSYSVEASSGVRPTTAAVYTQLTGLKEIPEMNPAPDTIETTTLDEEEYKTYVDGLKDLGGALGFTFNLTQEFIDKWEALMTAYAAGKAATKATWFVINIPGITKALYFKGNPSKLGLPSVGVNAALETSAYITPTAAPIWEAKPTA